VTLPSSAMKQTDAITIASLFSIAAMYNYAGQTATLQLQCPFERAAHSNDTRVRTKSVSRGTRNLLHPETASSQKCNCQFADIVQPTFCSIVDIDRSNAAIPAAAGKKRRPAAHSPALVARPSMMAMFCINS
jgi:hypothetical protein